MWKKTWSFYPTGIGFLNLFLCLPQDYKVSDVGSIEMVDLIIPLLSKQPIYTIRQFSIKLQCVNMAKLSYPLNIFWNHISLNGPNGFGSNLNYDRKHLVILGGTLYFVLCGTVTILTHSKHWSPFLTLKYFCDILILAILLPIQKSFS